MACKSVCRSLLYRAEDSVLVAVLVKGEVLLEWLQSALDILPYFYQTAQITIGRNSDELVPECRVNLLKVPQFHAQVKNAPQ
jgi:hypothetical protein